MAESLHTKIHQTTQSYFRMALIPAKTIKKTLLRHKLPVFTFSSLLLLSTPVGIAHFRNGFTQQIPAYSESQSNHTGYNTSDKSPTSDSDQPQSAAEQSIQSNDTGSSSVSGSFNSQSTNNGGQQSSSTPQLTINGQNVPIPANGSVHKNVQSSNQSVDVRVNNNSSSSASQSSSLNIQIQSHSTSSGSDNNDSSSSRDTSRLLTPRDRGY